MRGEQADQVGRLFEEVVGLLQRGHELDEPEPAARFIGMVDDDERPSEILTQDVLRGARGRQVRRSPAGQKRYIDTIAENVITFGIGPAGTVTHAAQARLDQLDSELKSNLASPRPDSLTFASNALDRLRDIPFSTEPTRRVECLLSVAQQFYHQGQSVFSGVEPAALAVMLAADLGDTALHRKSLTFQGIILSQTNNPGDALLSLAEALRLAESLHDSAAIAIVWNSLGGAFYEAALYSDARQCYERASLFAVDGGDLRHVRSSALTNAAICCLHTHHYKEGIEKIRDAIGLMASSIHPPSDWCACLPKAVYAATTGHRLCKGSFRASAVSQGICGRSKVLYAQRYLRHAPKAWSKFIQGSATWGCREA